MRIDCPFCGPRDHQEFVYRGGDAGAAPAGASEDEAVAAVYFPDNPAGEHQGLWYHRWGCRSWLRIRRDTRTHAILSVTLAQADAAL